MTYQIIITEETSANIIIDNNTTNVSISTSEYPITIEYNATQLTGAYGNANVAANLAAFGSNPISTTGNITAGYFLGNGSQLTGIAASSYGNANVAANLAAFGSNPISTTGNITAGYFVGNGSLLTSITGANVSGTVANATYALNANAATFAGTVTTNAQPNITSVGILTAVNTSGNVSATGNITGSYFLGNGSQLTGLPVQPGTYGNANVANFLGNGFGSNTITTTGNITTGNLLTGGQVSATGNVTGANINSAVFQAVNSAGGTLKNASGTTQASWGAGGGDNFAVSVSTNLNGVNAQVDISPTGTGHVHIKPTGTGSIEIAPTNAGSINNMVIGNVTPAAVSATTVSASGNVTAAYVIGNGSLLTSITGGNVTGTVANATYALTANASTYANVATFADTANAVAGANVSGTVGLAQFVTQAAQANITSVGTLTSLSVSGNTTSGNVLTGGLISATGNLTSGNVSTGIVSATGNIGSSQQTIFGYGNVSGASGNIVMSGKNIATDIIFSPDSQSGTTTPSPGRIVIGTGFQGNTSPFYDVGSGGRGARLLVSDYITKGNTASLIRGMMVQNFIELTANVTNTSSRISGFSAATVIGGGASTFTYTSNQQPNMLTGMQSQMHIGGSGQNFSAVGNVNVTHLATQNGVINLNPGSTVGNMFGQLGQMAITGNANSVIGYSITGTGSGNAVSTSTGNFFAYHLPGSTSTYGVSLTGAYRQAANYYFLRNDDDVAQCKLGSMRSYTDYNFVHGTTSGSLTISKTDSQVQQVNLAGNITSVAFSNFVSSASDGPNTDEQLDRVRVIFNQGATGGFGVTMPTGNAAIKYSGGVSAVGTTVNAVTVVDVKAVRLGGTTTYLVDVSAEYV